MPRGLDHLVLCVRDLKKAGALYDLLGFTLTPVNEHPFGTGNRLVQLDGFFLEILTVLNPEQIPEHDGEDFSFGAFNRDYMKTRDGMSMLVLDSTDETTDRADFTSKGLHVFKPFEFQRVAKTPDGDGPIVGFSLTFVDHPSMPDMTFFTCKQWRPDLFWKPDLQRHANGAQAIRRVYVISETPIEAADFMSAFVGSNVRDTDIGPTVETARGDICVMTPGRFDDRFPDEPAGTPPTGGFAVRVESLDTVADRLAGAGLPYRQDGSRVWLSSSEGFGCVVEFVEG